MIDSILQQAPDGVSRELVEELLKKHKGDGANVLAELWNIQETCKNTTYNEDAAKWKHVREICQAYEEEMENFMKSHRI